MPASVTDEAIENLATAFCKLSKLEHRPLYIEALQSLARIARDELVLQMEVAIAQAGNEPRTRH